MNKELNLNIDDLFKWKGQVEITDDQGNVIETLYQRVIGDADIQRARFAALKASKALRKDLKNPESDEYLVNIPLRGELPLEELIAVIIYSKAQELRKKAEEKIQEERVKEPRSDASLEKQENYIEELEQTRKEYDEALYEEIRKQAEKIEADLNTKSYDEVFDLYVAESIELLCRFRMVTTFDEYATFYGTYKDEDYKIRRFSSLEEFQDLATRIKDRLIRNYKLLELNLVDVKK
jgi:hypothetical protein